MFNMKHLWFEKGAYANRKSRAFLAKDFNPLLIKRIAVIRHAALGDQVITRPFLVELRKFFPNAIITLSAVSNYQYAMPDDLCDELHLLHGSDKKHDITIKEKISNIKALGEQDIIFDLAATNRSYWLTALSKAKLKIGFPYKSWVAKALYDVCVFRSDFTAELEVMLDMLRLLGHAPTYPLDFAYPSHLEMAKPSQPYIVYFNGGSQAYKMYPFDKMKTLMIKASKTLPHHRHIFLEGLNENEKGQFLGDLCEHKNIEIQPAMPLEALLTFIAKSRSVVSTDTGIRNIAIATHTPTVGIFYSTVPFRYTPISGNHKIVMTPNATQPTPEQILTVLSATQV